MKDVIKELIKQWGIRLVLETLSDHLRSNYRNNAELVLADDLDRARKRYEESTK